MQFLWLAVSSRAELSAEVLFLRKQLAFYQEHQVQPRKLTDAARFSLAQGLNGIEACGTNCRQHPTHERHGGKNKSGDQTEWGEYVGASSYGVAFKDSAGTLRFVAHFPCDLNNRPIVALAIERK
jgi:hypothetical protein